MLNCTSAVSGAASYLPSAPANTVLAAAVTVGACANIEAELRSRAVVRSPRAFMTVPPESQLNRQKVYMFVTVSGFRTWGSRGWLACKRMSEPAASSLSEGSEDDFDQQRLYHEGHEGTQEGRDLNRRERSERARCTQSQGEDCLWVRRLVELTCDLRSALGAGSVGGEVVDLRVDFLAQVLPDVVGHGEKDFHNFGIELAPRPALDLLPSRGQRLCRTVGPIRSDGVQRVGDREDSGSQGNLFT